MNILRSYSKTKIICTLGPSSSSVETLEKMMNAGMDVARLNFSHGNHNDHLIRLQTVRTAARNVGESIAILQDLQGPKIRIGKLVAEKIELRAGDAITISINERLGTKEIVSTTYQRFAEDVKPGDKILIDDGKLELRAISTKPTEVLCETIVGGILKPNKGINLPGVNVSSPSLTEKDEEDALFGLHNGVDYMALSFVRRASDVQYFRKFMLKNGFNIPIIAKIEKPEAINEIGNIIDVADGIMVARGDLGVEMPMEQVPVLQKMIAYQTAAKEKLLIVATQMLETMTENPFPTRAETNDVANAVLDGADAVMLSGETSIGKFPVQTVAMMDKIVRKAEEILPVRDIRTSDEKYSDINDAIGKAACVLAKKVNASGIAVLTHDGEIARKISSFRPKARIIAITDNEQTLRQLNLVWGVHGFVLERTPEHAEEGFRIIRKSLVEDGFAYRGDFIVEVSGIPFFESRNTDTIKIEKLE
ncbi:MAG: pyruvate kinase [Ignavibacteria bacterium]|nr:pyruvate kinase [Ignavibacteria bacterium]